MSIGVALLVTTGLLAANAFFVGAEFAVISARRSQIEPKAERGSRPAKTALYAMEHATLMLATFGAFGVISVSLTPGVGIAEDRERGWLRVKRVSPVPVRTTLAAKVVASLPVAFGVYAAMSLTALAMGRLDTDLLTWLKIAGLLLLGSLPFALLSIAVGFVARGRTATAIINAVFLPMAIAGGLWMPLEMLPSFVQHLSVWLPTYHMSQLGLGVLMGEPMIDHVGALLAATAVTASLAAVAYRSSRE